MRCPSPAELLTKKTSKMGQRNPRPDVSISCHCWGGAAGWLAQFRTSTVLTACHEAGPAGCDEGEIHRDTDLAGKIWGLQQRGGWDLGFRSTGSQSKGRRS